MERAVGEVSPVFLMRLEARKIENLHFIAHLFAEEIRVGNANCGANES